MGAPLGSENKPSARKKITSAENGKSLGAGRPGHDPELLQTIREARQRGARALPRLVDCMLYILSNPSAEDRDRVSAFREIASRCGLPVRLESEVAVGEIQPTLVDLRGFSTKRPKRERVKSKRVRPCDRLPDAPQTPEVARTPLIMDAVIPDDEACE